MRKDAIELEESRVAVTAPPEKHPPLMERHCVFPSIFENRNHHKILDLSAGLGYVTQRLIESYPATIISHDISPSCLMNLRQLRAPTLSFDIDSSNAGFPFASASFDAVISLVTIEHVLFANEFVSEIRRILCPEGYLYISTPNYAAPEYLIGPVFRGRSFHDPFTTSSGYEFYAHVRYYTFRTLKDFLETHGFVLDTVYLTTPRSSERYLKLKQQSRLKALIYKNLTWLKVNLLPPDRNPEPILCLQKTATPSPSRHCRKVVL